jgi:hypothetical protein
VAPPVIPTTSLHDVRVKREDTDIQSSPAQAPLRYDEHEPGQISSSTSKETVIHPPELVRSSSSMGNDIPGLAMFKPKKDMLATRFGEEDEEDRKPNVEELERRRLEELNRASSASHLQKAVASPNVDEAVNVSQAQSVMTGPSRNGEEQDQCEVHATIAVPGRKKRERSINTQAEQDEDQANRERGKALEAEREQTIQSLDVAGLESSKRTDAESERVLLQVQAAPDQAGNTEEEEEGSPMIESPQSMDSPALPSALEPVLPCHFVPGVWFIQNGSKIMETQDCHFEIDQYTVDKWALASR